MRSQALTLTAALALFSSIGAAGDLEDLKAAQKGWVEAFNRHDAAHLAATLHAAYTEFSSSSDTSTDWSTKPAEDRRIYFSESFAGCENWTIQILESQYSVAGETGIVSGTEKAARTPKGGVLQYPRTRFTNTWLKSGGRWLLLASHRSGLRRPRPERRRWRSMKRNNESSTPLWVCVGRASRLPMPGCCACSRRV